MTRQQDSIEGFIEAVCQLSMANRRTGIWDNRRYKECQKPFDEVDCQYLYKTEKLSREIVELWAVYRGKFDAVFEQLVKLTKNDG